MQHKYDVVWQIHLKLTLTIIMLRLSAAHTSSIQDVYEFFKSILRRGERASSP